MADISSLLSDYPAALKFASCRFAPQYRQNVHDTAGGAAIAVQTASPRWVMEARSIILRPAEYSDVIGWLMLLEEGLGVFQAHDPSRPLPLAYLSGAYPAPGSYTGTISSVTTDNRLLGINGLPAGFRVSAGDLCSFDYSASPTRKALHRFIEAGVANGSGVLAPLEVRPTVRPGWANGATVRFNKPRCWMRLIPGSVDYGEARGGDFPVVSFKAVQVPYA